MSTRPGVEWPGRRRGLGRVAALFAVTAGGYWPIWLVQIVPFTRMGSSARRGRMAAAAGALLPVVNIAFEVVLALLLPRAVRRLGEERGAQPPNTETQTFLLLAAPAAALALTFGLGIPFWVAGYLAWPLELPAALAVQSALNRLERGASPTARPAGAVDGELAASGAITVAIVVGVVLAIALGGSGGKKSAAPAHAAPQGPQVSDIAATPGALWVTRIDDNAVEQVDPATLHPTGKRVRVGRSPYDLAAGFGDLWVANYRSDSVSRVDPRSAHLKGRPIPTGRGPFGVSVGYGSVWVTDSVDRNLVQIDPGTNRVRRKIPVGLGPRGVAAGAGAVWVAGAGSVGVIRVDPASGATKRIPMPSFCQDVAVGGGSVWAILPQTNAMVRIDPATARRTGKLITTGLGPSSVEYGAGSVWVANGDGTLTQIDPATGRVTATRAVGSQLVDVTVMGNDVWVLRADGGVRHIRVR
jgi:YVTN family beta-propeller protein